MKKSDTYPVPEFDYFQFHSGVSGAFYCGPRYQSTVGQDPHQVALENAVLWSSGGPSPAMREDDDLPSSDERAVAVRLRERDRCQGCKRTAAEVQKLEIHEIVPLEEAANHLSNYVLLCTECHHAAHASDRENVRLNGNYGG